MLLNNPFFVIFEQNYFLRLYFDVDSQSIYGSYIKKTIFLFFCLSVFVCLSVYVFKLISGIY